jgi:hypothetical protein
MKHRSEIQQGAAKLQAMHEKIHATYQSRSAEWSQACEDFRSSYDSLAYPGGLQVGMAALKSSSEVAIETAIEFLEVDPIFFRSGYIKEELIQNLKRADLTDAQKERLNGVILRLVELRDCREFRRYCQLATRTKSPKLETELKRLISSNDPSVIRRALWVLDALPNREES